MIRRLASLLAVFCLGCAPAQAPAGPVDPAAVEAVRPSGPHAVGLIEGPTFADGVESRIYYPAGPGGEPSADRFGADHRAGLERRFGTAAADGLAQAVTAAHRAAPAAPGLFPLVVFQPGAAMAASDYRLLLEDLASRGYVVLALNPDGSPRASQARYGQAAAELVDAVARVRSAQVRVAGADLRRIALVGHSIGGAAAVMALSRTPNAVAINLDGDYAVPAPIPAGASALYLLGQTEGEADASRARRADAWRAASAASADATALQVVDLRHFDFADAALLQSVVPEDRRETRFGTLGGLAAHDLASDLVAGFLDSRLKGEPEAWTSARARRSEATSPSTW